jgi:oxygen-independent coproporphyrinogen-3 oxidase
LAHLIKTNQLAPVSTTHQAAQFELLMKWMEAAGYEHYEISNFALPGFRSKHNSAYWEGTTYLGLGPSAHSFNGKERQWNVSNNALYIKAIESGQVPFEKETLSATQQLNEYIMTALRRKEGISIGYVRERYNGATDAMLKRSSKFIEQGLMRYADDHLQLTNKGKLFADGIAADLFEVKM